MGRGCRAPQEGACSRGDQIQDQAADCARSAPRCLRGRRTARCRVGRFELRFQLRAARWRERTGLRYVVGIIPTIKVQAVLRRGKLGTRMSAKSLALKLPKHAWRTITWREGTNNVLRSRFARVQVRTAPIRRAAERPEETLLIEWPEGEDAPTKYWLSTVDKNISFRALVDLAKMRWRVERDYQELKQVVGLGHYEGRSWPGFHHHGTLCIAVYGFLVSERETIPPSGLGCSIRFEMPALPRGYRPRGAAAAAATSRPQLDRDPPPQSGLRNWPGSAAAMFRMCAQFSAKFAQKYVTQ